MLALTVSNSLIGAYSAATAFSTLIALFTYPISTVLFPLFSRSGEDSASLGRAYQTANWFTALLVTPVTCFIFSFAGPLLVSFYGGAYKFGAEYLALLAAMNLFAGLGSLAWNYLLNGIGQTKEALSATAIGSVIAVGTALFLTRSLGVVGAIAGQIAGVGVSLLFGTWMVKRRVMLGWGIFSVWRIYVASAITAAVCYPLSWIVGSAELSVVLGAAVFFILFIPLLALLKAVDVEHLKMLTGLFSFSSLLSKPLEIAVKYYELASKVYE
jgi:O-antigen/teichoic acid export membrane protein